MNCLHHIYCFGLHQQCLCFYWNLLRRNRRLLIGHINFQLYIFMILFNFIINLIQKYKHCSSNTETLDMKTISSIFMCSQGHYTIQQAPNTTKRGDSARNDKYAENKVISLSNAFAKKSTMMIVSLDTFNTEWTMVRIMRPIYSTGLAVQSLLIYFFLFILKQGSWVKVKKKKESQNINHSQCSQDHPDLLWNLRELQNKCEDSNQEHSKKYYFNVERQDLIIVMITFIFSKAKQVTFPNLTIKNERRLIFLISESSQIVLNLLSTSL